MIRPTSRVLAVLEILQAGGTRRAADLAGRLQVDERTVRRYVEHLLDLGIPVRSERGRYGGYRLEPGYRMPPLMLSEDEAVAVLLGLMVGERSGLVPGTAATESATAKLQRVLPAELRRRTEALLATVSLTAPRGPAAPLESDVLLVLAEAAREQRPVAITHSSRAGRATERVIHPRGIVAHSGRWYVAALDATTEQPRTFRLDRITTVSTQPGTFDPAPDSDLASDVLESLANTPWRHQVSLRVRGSLDEVRSRLPDGLTVLRPIDSDSEWVRVRLRAERLDWVPALVAGLDLPFVIEEPAELLALVRALAQRLTHGAQESEIVG